MYVIMCYLLILYLFVGYMFTAGFRMLVWSTSLSIMERAEEMSTRNVPGVVVWQQSWQSCNRPHYTHLRLSCWHRDVHSRSFSGSKRGQTRQPVLDREGIKCLQHHLEWRHACQVASTTESLHKMWCEIGKETLLDRIEPNSTELNNCVPC